MRTVQEMAREIVAREGGFVNDPDDPGGATKYGVTIHTMRGLGMDLDRDGDVDERDVKMLTKSQAEAIFINRYFDKPLLSMLPECLHDTVFDMQVNAGSNAVKILQRMLNDLGCGLSVDGGMGPKTASAAHDAAAKDPAMLRDAYGIARRNYYFAIGDRREASRKYCVTRAGGKGGWIKRAEEFMRPQWHMTSEQFNARIARWR